jgi:D-alanyl-D-alanine dipeptidase
MSNPIYDPGGGRIKNLTPANSYDIVHITGLRGKAIPVHREAAEAFNDMVKAFREETGIGGDVFAVVSGYRNPEIQEQLFQNAIIKYGSPKAARKWVAPPGKSAHQTGRALDINLGVPIGSKFVNRQRKTEAYAWLKENASRFGFYPYANEPWHWEYNPRGGMRNQYMADNENHKRAIEDMKNQSHPLKCAPYLGPQQFSPAPGLKPKEPPKNSSISGDKNNRIKPFENQSHPFKGAPYY